MEDIKDFYYDNVEISFEFSSNKLSRLIIIICCRRTIPHIGTR